MQNPAYSFAYTETAASKAQIVDRIFCDPGDARRPLFEEINFPSSDRTSLLPGTPLLIPHSQKVSIDGKKAAQKIAQSAVKGNSGVVMSPAAARLVNEEDELLKAMVNGALQAGSTLTDYMGTRLGHIGKDLESLERLYRDAPKVGLKLGSKQFLDEKSRIMSRIDSQMTGFARDHILGKGRATNMKQALGLRSKSTSAPFDLKGNSIQNVSKISEMTKKTQTLSNKIKGASKPLGALSIGMYAGEAMTAFKNDGLDAGARKTVENTWKFGGGKMGAKGGAIVGAKVGAALAFGLGTGGVGFALLGVAAVTTGIVGGSMAGSWAGGKLGGGLYDGTQSLLASRP